MTLCPQYIKAQRFLSFFNSLSLFLPSRVSSTCDNSPHSCLCALAQQHIMASTVISRSSNIPRCAPVPSHTVYPQTSTASSVNVLQAGYPATERPDCVLIYLHGYCSYGESCRFAHPPGYERGVPSGATVPVVPYAPLGPVYFPISTSNPDVRNLGATSAGTCHGSSVVSLPAKPLEESTKTEANLAHKTAPCRHYARNGGWCPVGEECKFIHDFAFPPREDASVSSKVGSPQRKKSRHCWAFVQGRCRSSSNGCEYFHPEAALVPSYFKYTPCAAGKTCSNWNNCPFKHLSTQPADAPNNRVAYFPINVQGLAPLEEEPASVEDSTTEFTTHPTAPTGPGHLNTAWQFPTTVTNASTVNSNKNNNMTGNRKGNGNKARHRRTITLDDRKVSCAPLIPGEARGHARRRSIVCTTGEVWVHDFPASQLRARNSFDESMVSGPLMGGRRNLAGI